MDDIRQQLVTNLAEELAKEHFSTLPVDPFYIAKQLDIHVEPLPPDKKTVSGILVYVNTIFGIQYATYINSAGFQNFCLAHELGHYTIPDHPEKILINGVHESHAGFTSSNECEREADLFAANLLMPSHLFVPLLNKIDKGLVAIESLAGACDTSLTATAIRYTEKTPDPVTIVMSEGNKVLYAFMSDEMKEINGLMWIKKGSPLPLNSVTYQFNQTNANILDGNRADGTACMSNWFGCDFSHEIYEEVIGLGDYGKTLTVLTLDNLPDQEELDEEENLIDSWTPKFRR